MSRPPARAAGPVVAIHAGAGSGHGLRGHEEACRAALHDALGAACARLDEGAGAVGAVVAAVEVLEDCELFNAGRGAALSSDGSAELSAAVMRGSDRAAGAVAGIRRTRHPVVAAGHVLDAPQVLMIGEPADAHAAGRGAEQVENAHFVTERQRRALQAREAVEAHGTVGAVCLDGDGRLAAATSTGGISGQAPGRVGDSPLIGAGTWADAAVAVSCTGEGEAFIRVAAAHHVAMLRSAGAALADACGAALAEVGRVGGQGGLIALDVRGDVALPFVTPVMPRAVWRPGAGAEVWVAQA